jgi:hypothetical protein
MKVHTWVQNFKSENESSYMGTKFHTYIMLVSNLIEMQL